MDIILISHHISTHQEDVVLINPTTPASYGHNPLLIVISHASFCDIWSHESCSDKLVSSTSFSDDSDSTFSWGWVSTNSYSTLLVISQWLDHFSWGSHRLNPTLQNTWSHWVQPTLQRPLIRGGQSHLIQHSGRLHIVGAGLHVQYIIRRSMGKVTGSRGVSHLISGCLDLVHVRFSTWGQSHVRSMHNPASRGGQSHLIQHMWASGLKRSIIVGINPRQIVVTRSINGELVISSEDL